MPERAMEETAAAVTRPLRSPKPAPHAPVRTPAPVWDAAGAHAPGAPSVVLAIQRTVGNQAVMRMLDAQKPGHPLAGPATAVQRSSENELDDEDDVQRTAAALHEPSDEAIRAAAAEGVRTPSTTLPHLDRIQASFGRHSIARIQAHVGPEAARASRAMNALAYASGDHVVFGATPDLRTAAHEAAHIVQQQAGVHLSGGIGRPGDPYEGHADAVAGTVVAGHSAEELLEPFAESAASRQSRNPMQTGGRVLRAVRGAEHARADQRAVPKEAAAVALAKVAAGDIQRVERKDEPGMRRWSDLKKKSKEKDDEEDNKGDDNMDWVEHKTQPGRPKAVKAERHQKYRAKGYGATIKGRLEPDTNLPSTLPVIAEDGEVRKITVERLGPDVKEGDKIDKTEWNLKEPSHLKPVTVLPRALGGNGKEALHVVLLPDATATELRRTIHDELKRIVIYGGASVKLIATITSAKTDTKHEANKVEVTYFQLNSKGEPAEEYKLTVSVAESAPTNKQDKPDDYRAGLSVKIHGDAAVRWHTRVKFQPAHKPTGDGTGMEANPLGPDHKLGQAPGDTGIWKERRTSLAAIANKRYIAGHLLNHHLGGPGNDARNLAPIPDTANKKHSDEVEEKIKSIVNEKHGWVYYKVAVDHDSVIEKKKKKNKKNVIDKESAGTEVEKKKEPVRNEKHEEVIDKEMSGMEEEEEIQVIYFPKRLNCTWYELDSHGERYGELHNKIIEIGAPTAGEGAHLSSDDKPGVMTDRNPAQARIAYDEVILDTEDVLRYQKPFMDKLIQVLRNLRVNEYILDHDPTKLPNLMDLTHAVAPDATRLEELKSDLTLLEERWAMLKIMEDQEERFKSQRDPREFTSFLNPESMKEVEQAISKAEDAMKVMTRLLKVASAATEALRAKEAEIEKLRVELKQKDATIYDMCAKMEEMQKKIHELEASNLQKRDFGKLAEEPGRNGTPPQEHDYD